MSGIREAFGRRLTELIEDRELDPAALAQAMGLKDSSALSHYKAGRRAPRFERLEALAREAGVSVPWLLGFELRPASVAAPGVPQEWAPYDWLHVCGEVGAGPGHRWEHEPDYQGDACATSDIGGRVPVLRHVLERVRALGAPRLLRVTELREQGRSMLPTITPGALLLVAVSEKLPLLPGRAYIVRDPADHGGLMCKQVAQYRDVEEEGLMLLSENPHFRRVRIPIDPQTDPYDRPRPVVGMVVRIMDQPAVPAAEDEVGAHRTDALDDELPVIRRDRIEE